MHACCWKWIWLLCWNEDFSSPRSHAVGLPEAVAQCCPVRSEASPTLSFISFVSRAFTAFAAVGLHRPQTCSKFGEGPRFFLSSLGSSTNRALLFPLWAVLRKKKKNKKNKSRFLKISPGSLWCWSHILWSSVKVGPLCTVHGRGGGRGHFVLSGVTIETTLVVKWKLTLKPGKAFVLHCNVTAYSP